MLGSTDANEGETQFSSSPKTLPKLRQVITSHHKDYKAKIT